MLKLLSTMAVTATLALAPQAFAQDATALPAACGATTAAPMAGMAMGGMDMGAPMDDAHKALMAGMEQMNANMMAGAANPDIDVAFVCGLPYTEKHDRPDRPVELLAAPVMADDRYRGLPIYFTDVIVRTNGEPDCLGHSSPKGDSVTAFIRFADSSKSFAFCESESPETCVGPFTRVPVAP